MKEDGCGGCSSGADGSGVLKDIAKMQRALTATGRSIYLSEEGNANITASSSDPSTYGNVRRVGHDIMGTWHSMLSEVDVASNLWPFAHNDSGKGGFFNDLDMVSLTWSTAVRCADCTLQSHTPIDGDWKPRRFREGPVDDAGALQPVARSQEPNPAEHGDR